MAQSSNPWYVEPLNLGGVAQDFMQGLQLGNQMKMQKDAMARQAEARQAFAGLSGLPTEEDLMAGYNDQVPPQAPNQAPQDQGGVPLMSAQNKPQELTPIDMEKLLPTDLSHIMDTKNAMSERAALDGIGHSGENHDDMMGHADQILNAPDNKKGAVVKGIIDQIVANGGDATPYAQLLRMSPTDAANHVKVARDLMERDYIRKLAANDPQMAMQYMTQKRAQRQQDIQNQMDQMRLALEMKQYNMPRTPIKVGEGETLYDPYTFQPIAGQSPSGLTSKELEGIDKINTNIQGMKEKTVQPFEDQYTLVNNALEGEKDLSKLSPAKQGAIMMAYLKVLNPTRMSQFSAEGVDDMKKLQGRLDALAADGTINMGAIKDMALGRLTDSQIRDLANTVVDRRNSAWQQHMQDVKPYVNMAYSRLGAKAKENLPDYSSFKPAGHYSTSAENSHPDSGKIVVQGGKRYRINPDGSGTEVQ